MKILYVHGVNVRETRNLYLDWNKAITTALSKYGYKDRVIPVGAFYNKYFEHAPINFFTYLEAVFELLGSLATSEAMRLARKNRSGKSFKSFDLESISNLLRWTAGMVAQFVVEDDLRKNCRDYIFDLIQKNDPEVICAHSLGSLICYDLATNDSRGKTAFAGRTFVTFGSQINNPCVRDRLWHRRIKMVETIDAWHHLFNPNDPVFTADISLPNQSRFHPLNVKFGAPFDLSSHDPVWQNSEKHPHTGYLDDKRTAEKVWKTLVRKFNS